MLLGSFHIRPLLKRHTRCLVTSVHPQNGPLKRGDKVTVAMSGGVDSSVTAALLAQSPLSLDLSAIFMRNWDTRDESGEDKIARCEWKEDWEDVQNVCEKLRIPCRMIDLSRQYWNAVFEPALDIWRAGQTPNPDVWCNKEIKFGALLDHAGVGDGWLATGHYARIDWNADSNGPTLPRLLRGIDKSKDQSYWLSGVASQKLSKALFPLGSLTKSQVRDIAKKSGLSTASKRESMGICFVGKKRSFSSFLDEYLPPNPGNIVDLSGKALAQHNGLWNFTIGQNARIAGLPKRMFVAAKNVKNNEVVVVDSPLHPSLMKTRIPVERFCWIWEDHPPNQALTEDGLCVEVKFRSVMQPAPAVLQMRDRNTGTITFRDPQYGISAGQIAVVYRGDWCLGGATIVEELF